MFAQGLNKRDYLSVMKSSIASQKKLRQWPHIFVMEMLHSCVPTYYAT